MAHEDKKIEKQRQYVAIDLKSFYASVECVERGLDPMTTNLVVADESRTEKTICLAVSPSLKAYGISGRARLFEVVQRVREINAGRLLKAPGQRFSGRSVYAGELDRSPELELSFIAAPPRMAHYMHYSSKIYGIYLRYIAPEDIHVYSVDEVFIDVTDYLYVYRMTAHELAMKLVHEVLDETGITATAGIGTNMYLAKVAMDIVAKHIPPDRDGVRIAELNEMSYRRALWDHRPITDFWRVGRGYAKRLSSIGLFTMGDVARCSLGKRGDFHNEELLYKTFGINAELLIDHAWGYEPCTIADIRSYRPSSKSLSSGQVLQSPYDHEHTEIVVREMAESLALEMTAKKLLSDQIVLSIGYDIENLKNPLRRERYKGRIKTDRYGREVPEPVHGSINLGRLTSSVSIIVEAAVTLFRRIADTGLLVRRVTIAADRIVDETRADCDDMAEQLSLFDMSGQLKDQASAADDDRLDQEKQLQEVVLDIKRKLGKNAIHKGLDLREGATGLSRNRQIGGHKA